MWFDSIVNFQTSLYYKYTHIYLHIIRRLSVHFISSSIILAKIIPYHLKYCTYWKRIRARRRRRWGISSQSLAEMIREENRLKESESESERQHTIVLTLTLRFSSISHQIFYFVLRGFLFYGFLVDFLVRF